MTCHFKVLHILILNLDVRLEYLNCCYSTVGRKIKKSPSQKTREINLTKTHFWSSLLNRYIHIKKLNMPKYSDLNHKYFGICIKIFYMLNGLVPRTKDAFCKIDFASFLSWTFLILRPTIQKKYYFFLPCEVAIFNYRFSSIIS